jgi:hypothetical protein
VYTDYNHASKDDILTNPIHIPSEVLLSNLQIGIPSISVLADLWACKDKVPILVSRWQKQKFLPNLMRSSMNIDIIIYRKTIGIIIDNPFDKAMVVYYRNFTISRTIEINNLGIF